MKLNDLPRKGDVITFGASRTQYKALEDFTVEEDQICCPVQAVQGGNTYPDHKIYPKFADIKYVSRAHPGDHLHQPKLTLADRYLLYVCPKCPDAWDIDNGYCPHCIEPFVPAWIVVDKGKSSFADPTLASQ